MRVYKVKSFTRYQKRERITDAMLVHAIKRAERGLVDASLGGGLIKQRIARKGQGKSGGYRTIIVYRRGDLAVFLLGYAKSELDNINDIELYDLQERTRSFLRLTTEQISLAITVQELMEVNYEDV